ncbi:AAA family ATPase [Nostoc sphaeroides]|uniref:AAA family ATPase n=1 Tax=Nostoc sphaeroides TaxID=446679 RepID=UPI0039773953
MASTVPQSPEISGYTITEQIYRSLRTTVYLAIQDNQKFPVVIKVLQQKYPTFGELVQFRNQYAIAKHLPLAGIIQPLSLEQFGNGYALVMADWGGISLETYIQQQPLDIADILGIAIQLADILHELHQHRVIHKDIKPANILIHPESKQVKLIDFSIASLLPKETQEIQNPKTLEGTLAYLAPEQTGRMNRSIDYRSDFYALGVTLYQLLTGRLPFIADDPLELVYCHIAKIATPAHQVNTDVPEILGAIVTKLMAKNAEDRYQSALGLKHDLDGCCSQWKQTGSIVAFDLGQRDLCDRFLIPEKLYGRETEVQTLLDAFERVAQGSSEMMLVAGFSGIGKTAVVNEVHKPIVKQRGYFIKGKFDQFNRNIPFFAFVQAFRDLVGQLLSESDAQLQTWKTQILAALGENAQIIIDLIPELEKIVGSQPPAVELSGTAAQRQFNLLFQKFIQVFTTLEHPLVIFVDDLQWADSASLHLIKILMAESQTGHLLLLGAYRDNEVFPAHPFMLTLKELKKVGAIINTITLQPLSASSLNHLIADILSAPAQVVQPLTDLVMQKTQGNPFFATQFLKALHQDQLITFDRNAGHWQCDLVQVQDAALTDDVIEFMALQLQKLPASTQQILKLAACIGAQFDLTTLAIISEQSQTQVATILWPALKEGLVLPKSDLYKFYVGETTTTPQKELDATLSYKFCHDRVQQAAYSLIEPQQTTAVHLKIGQQLRDGIPHYEWDSHIFEIVNHLNRGIELIEPPQEREQLAHLNQKAGTIAKKSAAFDAAMNYLNTGLSLLTPQCWQNQYNLSLELHQLAGEVAYLLGNSDHQNQLIETGLRFARTKLDCCQFHVVKILALVAQNRQREAILWGFKVLQGFGVRLPENPAQWQIKLGLLATLRPMLGKSPKHLLKLPLMSNPEKIAVCKLLNIMGSAAAISKPQLLPLITFEVIRLNLQYGYFPACSPHFTILAFVFCEKLGKVKTGYELGKVSIELCHQTNTKAGLAATLFLWNYYVSHRRESVRNALPSFLEAYQIGLEVGDLEYSAYSLTNYFGYAYRIGHNLQDLQQEIIASRPAIQKLNQTTMASLYDLYSQVFDNLTTVPDDVCAIKGKFFDEKVVTDPLTQSFVNVNKLMLAALFDRYTLARDCLELLKSFVTTMDGTFLKILYLFYDALVRLAEYPKQKPSQQKIDLKRINTSRQILAKLAKSAPMNFLNKQLLVEAEYQRIIGQSTQAGNYYDLAISHAQTNGYIHEEALANEIAAKFYLAQGKEKVAAAYMQEAYYCYSRWGAKAKVADLEARYSQLLGPILQQTMTSTDMLTTLMTIAAPAVSVHKGSHSSSRSTKINQTLDFAFILKASQALSSTIQFDELLHQLTQIILQNSGADRYALILLSETAEWLVRAIATPNETQLCAEPLTNNFHVPVKLIQYVKNTQEVVVIDNMETTLPVIGDYLRQHQPKSILCMPLLHQGHLIGILYLNNQLTSGVFTEERILILNFLCTQAAISLENARLYQQLEHSLQDAQQKSQDLAEVLALSNGQQQILALIAQGVSLNTILAATARSIESHAHHPAYCSFLLIDAEGRLRCAAAPSLPAAYNALIDGLKIGPEVGSCGTAAYCKASVTVTDIATDPLWANYQVALDFGLRACTSTPILGAEGQVLATLAMYQPVAGEFTLHDRKLMEVATYLARIAIERHQADVELQNTQLQMVQSEKMASLGNLVAGVAHEINNPIGFLNGSITNGQEYVQDLLGHLALYQQHYPNPVEPIQKNAKEIDLEFLLEDLFKLLDSMTRATDIASQISVIVFVPSPVLIPNTKSVPISMKDSIARY